MSRADAPLPQRETAAYRLFHFYDGKHRHPDADDGRAVRERHRMRLEKGLHERRVCENGLRGHNDRHADNDGARSGHALTSQPPVVS